MTTTEADPNVCVNSATAADLIGVKQATLRSWRMRGEGPPSFKAGGVVLYRLAKLHAWLNDLEARGT